MADQTRTNEFESVRAFIDGIRKGDLKKIYFFYGEEEWTKDSALNALEKAVLRDCPCPELNRTVLTDPDPDTLLSAMQTVPLMADKRILTVRDFSLFSARAGEADRVLEEMEKGLEALPEETCLVFLERGNPDAKRKFFRLLGKMGCAREFRHLEKDGLCRWLQQEARRMGKSLSERDAAFLAECVGSDLGTLKNELDKLAAYAGDAAVITQKDILAAATVNREFRLFEMTDALLQGNGKKAFAQYRILKENREDEVHLLSILGEQCRRIRYCRILTQQRVGAAQIASMLKMPLFAVERSARVGARYTPEQLLAMGRMCREMEFRAKSGQIGTDGVMETLMLQILALGTNPGTEEEDL